MTTISRPSDNTHARQELTSAITGLSASMNAFNRQTIDDARALAACDDADAISTWLTQHGRSTVTGPAAYAAGFGTLAAMITELAALAEQSLEGAR